jgi:hypothetical protein
MTQRARRKHPHRAPPSWTYGECRMSDDATEIRQLRAVRRAALQAREEARLAYQFSPNSYTCGALAQIELLLVRLAEMEP